MARSRFLVVISYDISRPKTRGKVAKLLEGHMTRVQQSVFEGELTEKAASHLFDTAERIIKQGDSLRMYVVTKLGREKCQSAGGAPISEGADFWLL